MAEGARPELLEHVRRLADRALSQNPGETLILGVAGAQGSGKSTLARNFVADLTAQGVPTAAISIDDFYLSRAARRKRAADIHPLFVTRGPPGTHDIPAACALLDALRAGRGALAPVFDKSRDDVCPAENWRRIPPGVKIVFFEGWCLGARAQVETALDQPLNMLERIFDPDRIWRRAVNAALAGDYPALFGRIDRLVYLRPPSFEVIARWRGQQERELAERAVGSIGVMDSDEISYFVQHYERITRWMMEDLPSRADLTLQLDERRRVVAVGSVKPGG